MPDKSGDARGSRRAVIVGMWRGLVREDKLLWFICYHEQDVNPATVPLPSETPHPHKVRGLQLAEDRRAARALSRWYVGHARAV